MFQSEVLTSAFNQAAKTYDNSAIVQREVADRLLERLDIMPIEAQTILDLGCGTAYCVHQLRHQYPQAQLIALDQAYSMLQLAQQTRSQKLSYLCSDAGRLPFADQSIDLIISNFLLHWLPLSESLYAELQRVLRPNGLLLFSTLGPDTLIELRTSWAAVDDLAHVHDFIDMHHIGDVLLKSRFNGPVMEREMLTINYDTVPEIMRDMQQLGVSNKHSDRRRTLTGSSRFKQMMTQYEQFRDEHGQYPVSYEVIYGHAWGADTVTQRVSEIGNEVRIPLNAIRSRK